MVHTNIYIYTQYTYLRCWISKAHQALPERFMHDNLPFNGVYHFFIPHNNTYSNLTKTIHQQNMVSKWNQVSDLESMIIFHQS